MFKKIKITNKKAFIAMLVFIAAGFSHETIAPIAKRKGIIAWHDSSYLLPIAIAVTLFAMSLGYDGGKHKKWVIASQAVIGALYVFEVVSLVFQPSISFWDKWLYINQNSAIALMILPLILTALANIRKAKSANEAPKTEQSVTDITGKY